MQFFDILQLCFQEELYFQEKLKNQIYSKCNFWTSCNSVFRKSSAAADDNKYGRKTMASPRYYFWLWTRAPPHEADRYTFDITFCGKNEGPNGYYYQQQQPVFRTGKVQSLQVHYIIYKRFDINQGYQSLLCLL
jgi:hypothetical protein